MPGILEKIAAIELEMSRTQKNKATTTHLGSLKAKLCALRRELLEPSKAGGGKQAGFEVQRYGDSRIALIGFPSVGKSSLLTALTGVQSEAAAYEFTTLTCIPGVILYNDAKIQLLDLPGIISGAAQGKGRGRQVIATARSADMIIMVLDATKDDAQRQMLTKELEDVGIRLNKKRPKISVIKTKTGGLKYNATVPVTQLSRDMVYTILQQYKTYNVDVVIQEDASVDDFIDVLEEQGTAPRRYCRCLYVYNKIDMLSMSQVDALARDVNEHECFTSIDFEADGINGQPFKTDGTDIMIWSANGKDKFAGYHGRTDRAKMSVEWSTGTVKVIKKKKEEKKDPNSSARMTTSLAIVFGLLATVAFF